MLQKKEISMPQLDVTTFFSQFFWLSFFFLGFYGILVKFYLPKFSRILKIRTRKVSALSGASDAGSIGVRHDIDSLVQSGMKSSFEQFQTKTQKTSVWMQEVFDSLHKTQFQEVNTKYFTTLGDFAANQSLLAHFQKSLCSPQDFRDLGVHNAKLQAVAKEKVFNLRLFETLS